MSKGYWVKGYPFKNTDRIEYSDKPVIHRFDTEKEAEFFRSQVAHGEMLPWGEIGGENDKESNR